MHPYTDDNMHSYNHDNSIGQYEQLSYILSSLHECTYNLYATITRVHVCVYTLCLHVYFHEIYILVQGGEDP